MATTTTTMKSICLQDPTPPPLRLRLKSVGSTQRPDISNSNANLHCTLHHALNHHEPLPVIPQELLKGAESFGSISNFEKLSPLAQADVVIMELVMRLREVEKALKAEVEGALC